MLLSQKAPSSSARRQRRVPPARVTYRRRRPNAAPLFSMASLLARRGSYAVIAGSGLLCGHRLAFAEPEPEPAAGEAPTPPGIYSKGAFDPAPVEALLRFLYTGAACAPDAELEPVPLLDLAVLYQVTPNAANELEHPESYRLISAVSMPISDMQRPCVCKIRKKKAIFFLSGNLPRG